MGQRQAGLTWWAKLLLIIEAALRGLTGLQFRLTFVPGAFRTRVTLYKREIKPREADPVMLCTQATLPQ